LSVALNNSEVRIAVLGAGSWGTALAYLLGRKGYNVTLWGRSPDLISRMCLSRENDVYLPGVVLPENIALTSSLEQALARSLYVITAPPCVGVRALMEKARVYLCAEARVLSATKGLLPDTAQRPSEVILENIGSGYVDRTAVLSGPNLAREVVRGIPTTTVIACGNLQTAEEFQQLFSSPTFRVYTNEDIAGVELGGALKNIIAIGAGVSDGLGFGDNTKAALVTRGLVEITRLGVALGGKAETFTGLAGMGDLFATCVSKHSRNYQVGFRLAQGENLAQIAQSTPMIAEGVPTTQAAMRYAMEHEIEMPITHEIYLMLFKGKDPRSAVADLMHRAAKQELVDVPWFLTGVRKTGEKLETSSI